MNKIENTKLNKKLVGDEVTVSKVKPRGPRGPRHPRQPQAPKWFEEFEERINKRFDNLIKVNNLHE